MSAAQHRGEPFNACLIVVGVIKGSGPDRFVIQSRVDADMGFEFPDPPPTMDEMQPVAYAAKMALAKVLRKRQRRRRPAPSSTPDAAPPAERGAVSAGGQ